MRVKLIKIVKNILPKPIDMALMRVIGRMHYNKLKRIVSHNDRHMLDTISYGIYRFMDDYSIDGYLTLKQIVEQRNVLYLSKKTKIKVAFVVYTPSMWFFDELYKKLSRNRTFEPAVIIGHFKMNDKNSSDNEFEKAFRWFENNGNYHIVSPEHVQEYDVLFYLTPGVFHEENLNLKNIPLSKLILHVSYSYMLAGNMSKLMMPMYHWSYRYYTDSKFYLDLISNVRSYSNNARYMGFPKMDQFYNSMGKIFSEKKIIIYAPHHSVNYTEFKSSTFESNYNFILELIQKYKDKVYWIYKPHPLLRSHTVAANIFSNVDEYDEYVNKLKNTGDVFVADSGDYFGLFKTSDAMITDSVSFLAEYQFSGKPLLLLMSGQEKYNKFGESLIEILYKCPGDDFDGIEKFVNDVIEDRDSMSPLRKKYFIENLDYMSKFEKSANLRIYDDILSIFEKN